MIRFTSFLSAVLLAFSAVSCSSGYNHDWNRSVAAGSPADITGAWTGTWRSEANGHHGELRCIVSRIDAKAGTCRFHYHATFMGFLSATYDVTHVVRSAPGAFLFSGDQELTGTGGGMYHYEGKATAKEFHATFRSSSDHGVFEMKRP